MSKLYQLGELHKQTNSLRERLARYFRHAHKSSEDDIIWALKNITFEVKQGEAVGIIGRNGAGKSTLLKILSRITKPTHGRAWTYSRVGSLLEVGTGFHPELTGRENIFLNGAILGMKRSEIKRKFDEIVSFAEIERFIDTPVKRYSSGMYVRLAFAVAAHLDPDILLVDEVLAVGDAAFQKKCLGKMGKATAQGRTILFVSHNVLAVSSLCSRAILLNDGSIVLDDVPEKTVARYIQEVIQSAQIDLAARADRVGLGETRFKKIWIENDNGENVGVVSSGQDISIAVLYESDRGSILRNPYVAFAIRGPSGEKISDLWNQSSGYSWEEIPTKGIIRCVIPRLPLNAGTYTIDAYLQVNGIVEDYVQNAGKLIVEAGDYFGTGRLPKSEHGHSLINQRWKVYAP